ncbi:MAG: hypothetical protein ABDH21_04685 [bacterium]
MILLDNIFQYQTLSKIKDILIFIDSLGVEWGFVGGIPRDFLLFKTKLKTNEIDIVFLVPVTKIFLLIVDKFKDLVAQKYFHDRFITGKVVLTNGTVIDVITAREEFYASEAQLPIVEPTSNIKADIYRRDITINAIFFKRKLKHPDKIFEIIDLVGGYKDLIQSVCRFIYPTSLQDDPTRIYRILRYKNRFNFKVENNSLEMIKNSLHYIDLLSINRVYNELTKINQEKKFDKIYEDFFKIGFDPINLNSFNPHNLQIVKDLKILRKSIISFEKFFAHHQKKLKLCIDRNKIIFSFLVSKNFLKNEKYQNILSKDIYKFSNIWREILSINPLTSKSLKKFYIQELNKYNCIEVFVALIYMLYQHQRTDLKKIVRYLFRKKYLNRFKITAKFIHSIAQYYYPQKNICQNTILNLLKKANYLYYLNKIRTSSQLIRYVRKKLTK